MISDSPYHLNMKSNPRMPLDFISRKQMKERLEAEITMRRFSIVSSKQVATMFEIITDNFIANY